MSTVPYCELVNLPDQPAPEREIMPSAPEMNDVNILVSQNRNRENESIIIPENQLHDQEWNMQTNLSWSLLLIIWVGAHVALLLLALLDKKLSEGVKIWTAIICVVETVLMSATVIFRNIEFVLVCIYFLEFVITVILLAVYLTETIAFDLLLLLSVIKLFVSCHKLRLNGF